jgi:hypothetical protein
MTGEFLAPGREGEIFTGRLTDALQRVYENVKKCARLTQNIAPSPHTTECRDSDNAMPSVFINPEIILDEGRSMTLRSGIVEELKQALGRTVAEQHAEHPVRFHCGRSAAGEEFLFIGP